MDVAYQLFDGKFSMEQISNMPYKKLIHEMQKEEKNLKENAQARADKKIAKALGGA